MASPEAFQVKYPVELSDVNNELADSCSNFKFAMDDDQRERARNIRLRQVFGGYQGITRDGNQSFDEYTSSINGKCSFEFKKCFKVHEEHFYCVL